MAPRRILRQSEQDAIFREAGAPEHPDAQWRADYLRKLYDNATHHNDPGVTGGPTMNAEDLPQSGTMVSIPGAEKQYPTMPSSQQVKEYFDTHHFGPEDYPGGWEWPPPTTRPTTTPRASTWTSHATTPIRGKRGRLPWKATKSASTTCPATGLSRANLPQS